MVQLRKQAPVQVVTNTQNGECQVNINLEITINLEADGIRGLAPRESFEKEPSEKEPDHYLIPDFDNLPKVQFGKQA